MIGTFIFLFMFFTFILATPAGIIITLLGSLLGLTILKAKNKPKKMLFLFWIIGGIISFIAWSVFISILWKKIDISAEGYILAYKAYSCISATPGVIFAGGGITQLLGGIFIPKEKIRGTNDI